jgi:hypothetical protein
MPSPKQISQIKSNLLRPALTSHFEVEIPFPSSIQGALGTQKEMLLLSCSEASLPGSRLATAEINNSRTGVTERHAYRRIYDDSIDLTFYVDAKNYLPIQTFESWIRYIMNEDVNEAMSKDYAYNSRYPDEYIMDQGLIVRKFERDYQSQLTYEFVRSFPISISSMPVSYDTSSLLKCTVSMSYIRYLIKESSGGGSNSSSRSTQPTINPFSPIEQARFNSSNLTIPGFEGESLLTTGGVSKEVAKLSGNSIDRRVEAGLPYVGRNVGPIATFSGI